MGASRGKPSEERRERVDSARAGWRRRLVDLSRRNNLLFFRELKKGTLALPRLQAQSLESLLAGRSVSLDAIVAQVSGDGAAELLRPISAKALENSEERGLETLFVACAFATWTLRDGGSPPRAPLLLVPVLVSAKGRGALSRSGEPQVNEAVLQLLAEDRGLELDLLIQALRPKNGSDSGRSEESWSLAGLVEAFTQAVGGTPGIVVKQEAFLGNFSFQKMAMLRDFDQLGEQLAAHDLVAALAGDPGARASLTRTDGGDEPRRLDARPPESEFLILDADSSQQLVIEAALRGESLVVQGPPGTGKSQTIANLIASLVAGGKRVLFIAEKRAALGAVADRLEDCGLKHLTLDLHGAELSRREIMQRLGAALEEAQSAAPAGAAQVHGELVRLRETLNAHADRIHAPRAPSGLSVFELEARLLRMKHPVTSRWRGAALEALTEERVRAIEEALDECAAVESFVLRRDPSPWTHARVANREQATELLALIEQGRDELLPAVRMAFTEIQASTAATTATLEAARAWGRLVGSLRAMLCVLWPDVFEREQLTSLAPLRVGQGWLARTWARLTNAPYRAAHRLVRSLAEPGTPMPALLEAVEQARTVTAEWRALTPGPVRPKAAANQVGEAVERLDVALVKLAVVLDLPPGPDLKLDVLEEFLNRLASEASDVARVGLARELTSRLEFLGALTLLQELERIRVPAVEWVEAFRTAYWRSCLDHVRLRDPALASFDGCTHGRRVQQFVSLDVERTRLAAARVRRAHAEALVAVMNAHPDQEGLVRAEIAKKSRHLPLRRLVERAPEVMTRVCPCWMASPLSVSQLIPGDRPYFDVVVVDEASQILPQDAIVALLRGKQAIVAGDRHQLPPTMFFADGGDSDDDDEASSGFESLLDLMSPVVRQTMLRWHYRSHDELLIAFSNRTVYGGRLVTFPGIGAFPALEFVHVPEDRSIEEDSSSREVEEVVRRVIEHARTRPGESLGVITLSMKHKERIEKALRLARRELPELEDFFAVSRRHRFFVKNLETVQGDERDAVILSLGYAKRDGRLSHNFGPINQDGGERRLNVAVTRAKRRLTLVASFTHEDIDSARSGAKGVAFLRGYLEFVRTGGRSLSALGAAPTPLNDFEQDIHDALSTAGIPLLTQWGASGYRIDLVAQHPERPGRLVLAIECDGASYHAAPTARDRDRLRQERLEALGWRFHRIWSTDWFEHRAREIGRAVEAYRRALDDADRRDAREGQGTAGPQSSEFSVVLQPPPVPVIARRSPAAIRRGLRIDEYSDRELSDILQWIRSDELPRTDEQLLEELVRELGFKRRGSRIEARLRETVRRRV